MISARCCLLILVLLHMSNARVVQPSKVDIDDEDSVYVPLAKPEAAPLGALMHMAYNHSVPADAVRACEREYAAACPSPSADGTHLCVSLGDICDHRPQCPGGEDETPVICFFHEMHSMELARLRKHAIELYREISHHAPRSHGQ